jgi:hypothetical protein
LVVDFDTKRFGSLAENASCCCCCCSANKFANLQGRQRSPPPVLLLYYFCSLRYANHDWLVLQAIFVSIIQKRRKGREPAQRYLFPMQLYRAVVHFTYSCVKSRGSSSDRPMLFMAWVIIRHSLCDTRSNELTVGPVNRLRCMALPTLERAQ